MKKYCRGDYFDVEVQGLLGVEFRGDIIGKFN